VLAFAKEVTVLIEGFLTRALGSWTARGLRLAEFAAGKVDTLHEALVKAPSIAKIVFCGSVCTPIFMMAMGQLQIFSLDIVGIPGKRTYRLAVALYLLILARAIKMKDLTGPSRVSRDVQELNIILFRAIAAFYAVQCACSALGKPEQHVSTGCHQKVGRPGDKIVKDIMGFKREEHVSEIEGPRLYSKDDYVFPGHNLDGIYDPAGRKIIRGKADDKISCEWYTVVGKAVPFQRRLQEMAGVFTFSAIGSAIYGWALSGPSS